jgi:hypothetical protein
MRWAVVDRWRALLGQHRVIRRGLVGVFVAPFADHVGQERDARARDVGQPAACSATWLVAKIIPTSATTVTSESLVSSLVRVDHREHRRGLGLVALECLDCQREPVGINSPTRTA